ncbi:hypothetical protein [uncultured Robinsoniella sp.]|uniref:hypothetical protein n=1 Tax=uncultured Robinsoniella sp. TaxID=904190 RepID=UPI00374EF777
MKKRIHLAAGFLIVISAGICQSTMTAKANNIPFNLRFGAGIETKASLDLLLKNTVIVPQASAEISEDSEENPDVYEGNPLPFDLSTELGMETKEELDEAIKEKIPRLVMREDDSNESTVSKEEKGDKTKDQAKNAAKEAAEIQETADSEFSRDQLQVYDKVIMVGDSRFVGMSSAANHPLCQWICEVSMGYDWLVSEAAPVIDASVVPNCAIVINLGVNDVYRPGDYAAYLNSKIDGWIGAGADVYFMSVNPVVDGYGGSVTNAAVEQFNSTMTATLSQKIGYIDTYNYLIQNGYGTADGLHYDASTYAAILNYCLRQLRVP